jgi:hypothetical protein
LPVLRISVKTAGLQGNENKSFLFCFCILEIAETTRPYILAPQSDLQEMNLVLEFAGIDVSTTVSKSSSELSQLVSHLTDTWNFDGTSLL